jgi:hypothetical protein
MLWLSDLLYLFSIAIATQYYMLAESDSEEKFVLQASVQLWLNIKYM